MNSEYNRLRTFCNWPTSAPVDPPRIAKAGFYYTGVELEVQCFSCEGKISNWNYGDQVMWKHRQLKPNCPFVLNPTNSGNVPLVDVFECNSTDEPVSWNVEEPQGNNDNTSHDYGLTEDDEMYRSDALRLLSFVNWDDPSISREALVNAGFYHAGEGRLRCAWCGGELTTFRTFGALGNPIEIHRMYFPRCDHAATLEAAQQSGGARSEPSSPPSDTPPIRSPETNENQTLSSGAAHNSRILNAGNTWRALGVVGSGARHPGHTSLSTRLATFDRWPADRTQSPRDMAEAGFFHTGTDDQVRCFYCDGGLGRWEAGDAPWSEHARWFPHCGYVLLVKGQEFVDQCRDNTNTNPVAPNNIVLANRRNAATAHNISESMIDDEMVSETTLGALSAGLDAARVRRAILRRLRNTGTPFTCSEGLIDAVLDDQLNETAWSVSTQSQRFARDILAETLRDLVPGSRLIPPLQTDDRPDSQTSQSDRTRTPSPNPTPTRLNVLRPSNQPTNNQQTANQQPTNQQLTNQQPANQQLTNQQPANQQLTNQQPANQQPTNQNYALDHSKPSENCAKANQSEDESDCASENRNKSLEEENRQLKEARLCKVCMDSEVSVVFLPCGHLVSCARCGAALAACPLCRAAVKALVRAYLA